MAEKPLDEIRDALLEAELRAGLDAQTGQLERTEWVDEATGYRCLAMLNHFRAFVGYVEVPPDHPYFGIPTLIDDPDYEIHLRDYVYKPGYRTNEAFEPVEDLDCHGGVTFAGVAMGCEEGTWWIGFDCLHAWDLAPGLEDTLRVAMGEGEYTRHRQVFPDDSTFKGLDYVKANCALLAAQLKAVEIEDKAIKKGNDGTQGR